jgi:hypothetical protein
MRRIYMAESAQYTSEFERLLRAGMFACSLYFAPGKGVDDVLTRLRAEGFEISSAPCGNCGVGTMFWIQAIRLARVLEGRENKERGE